MVPNYQRIVVFRLGRICPPKGPGIVLVLPLIDQWQRVDLRTRAFNIPPCQVNYHTPFIISHLLGWTTCLSTDTLTLHRSGKVMLLINHTELVVHVLLCPTDGGVGSLLFSVKVKGVIRHWADSDGWYLRVVTSYFQQSSVSFSHCSVFQS